MSGATESKARHWTDAENATLRSMARKTNAAELAVMLNRSVWAVRCHMRLLGLRGAQAWTAEEDAVLLNAPRGTKIDDLVKQLGRSWQAVFQRKRSIGAEFCSKCYWTAEEDATIRELAWRVAPEEIAAKLKRTEWAVKGRIQRLGIKQGRAWTAEQDAMLIAAGPNATIRELVEKTGRSYNAVWHRRIMLECSGKSKRHWSDAEIEQLRREASQFSPRDVAARLGRSVRAVEHKMREIGLKIPGFRAKPACRQVATKPRAARARTVTVMVSSVAYCAVCSAPVVNTFEGWNAHNARLGCNRKAVAARVA